MKNVYSIQYAAVYIDIVKDIFFGRCQKVVIMSGDADLIYPLEIVKSLDIPTYAIFLSNRFSLEMAYKVKRAYVKIS